MNQQNYKGDLDNQTDLMKGQRQFELPMKGDRHGNNQSNSRKGTVKGADSGHP